jgi:type I restriction enzyme M protein
MTELSIPRLLKEIRRRLGLTQEQLAHRIGVSFTSVNHWERGRRRPIPIALDKIKTLAQQANINLADFTKAEEEEL